MIQTYLESSNIISSLGWNTRENVDAVVADRDGIFVSDDPGLSHAPFSVSMIDPGEVEARFGQLAPGQLFTRFEKTGILSIHDALSGSDIDPSDPATAFILSTTKGNVELLENSNGFGKDRLLLWKSAEVMARFFGMKNRPYVVSNACISGVVAMLLARRLISGGQYDHAIILGADIISKFIVSGFQSFLSLSEQSCRPFDKDRDGLTLGEAAGTVILSKQYGDVELVRGAISNDANHISGPSRTGEGLLLAIQNTLKQGDEVDMISAHGTATVYNDEMESKAISRAHLESNPVNSLKGYIGHTLGAAGIVESILNIEAMRNDMLLATKGYSSHGVTGNIKVIDKVVHGNIQSVLKTASGFGGCNAAALFRKC